MKMPTKAQERALQYMLDNQDGMSSGSVILCEPTPPVFALPSVGMPNLQRSTFAVMVQEEWVKESSYVPYHWNIGPLGIAALRGWRVSAA